MRQPDLTVFDVAQIPVLCVAVFAGIHHGRIARRTDVVQKCGRVLASLRLSHILDPVLSQTFAVIDHRIGDLIFLNDIDNPCRFLLCLFLVNRLGIEIHADFDIICQSALDIALKIRVHHNIAGLVAAVSHSDNRKFHPAGRHLGPVDGILPFGHVNSVRTAYVLIFPRFFLLFLFFFLLLDYFLNIKLFGASLIGIVLGLRVFLIVDGRYHDRWNLNLFLLCRGFLLLLLGCRFFFCRRRLGRRLLPVNRFQRLPQLFQQRLSHQTSAQKIRFIHRFQIFAGQLVVQDDILRIVRELGLRFRFRLRRGRLRQNSGPQRYRRAASCHNDPGQDSGCHLIGRDPYLYRFDTCTDFTSHCFLLLHTDESWQKYIHSLW